MVVEETRKGHLLPQVRASVEPGYTIYTDPLASYTGLGEAYAHETVDHAVEYVRDRCLLSLKGGSVTSSWLKRCRSWLHHDSIRLHRDTCWPSLERMTPM
jgi:hypothetical protein